MDVTTSWHIKLNNTPGINTPGINTPGINPARTMRLIYPASLAKSDTLSIAVITREFCALVWTLYKPSIKCQKLDYMPGLIVSLYSARKRHGSYDDLRLVVMVTPDVPESDLIIISKFADHIWQVPYVTRPVTLGVMIAARAEAGQWINACFTKFNALALPYKKIILLDCDTLILHSVVDLFTLETPAACYAHPGHRPYGPAANYYIQSGRVFPDHGEKIPTHAICEMIKDTYVLNGAVLVLTPSTSEFVEFIDMLDKFKFGFVECLSKPDEQAMTMFYGKKNISITNLSAVYNSTVFRHSYLGNATAQIMHFPGAVKPWHTPNGHSPAQWYQYAAACNSIGHVDLSAYTAYRINRAVKIILRKLHIDKQRVNRETGKCLVYQTTSETGSNKKPKLDNQSLDNQSLDNQSLDNQSLNSMPLADFKPGRLIYDIHYAEQRRMQFLADKSAIAWCDAIFTVE